MTVTGDDLRHALSWDEVTAVVELAARNGVHIPGTSFNWEHTYIPLTPAAAASHGHGKIPKGWHAPSGGGGGRSAASAKAHATASATARKTAAKAAPAEAAAEDKSMALHRLAQINERLMYHKRPDPRIGMVAHQLSAHLSNGGKPGYDMGTAKTLLSSLEHFAGQGKTGHDPRLVSDIGSLREEIEGHEYARSPEGKADIAATAAAKAEPAKPAPARQPTHTEQAAARQAAEDKAYQARTDQMLKEQKATEKAAGESNARGQDRMTARHNAQVAHMAEATGIVFPHPQDISPNSRDASQAADHFRAGNLPAAADALDRAAASDGNKARAAKIGKMAANLRATTVKPTLPALAKVTNTQKADGSFTALDHEGTEHIIKMDKANTKSSVSTAKGKLYDSTSNAVQKPTETARKPPRGSRRPT